MDVVQLTTSAIALVSPVYERRVMLLRRSAAALGSISAFPTGLALLRVFKAGTRAEKWGAVKDQLVVWRASRRSIRLHLAQPDRLTLRMYSHVGATVVDLSKANTLVILHRRIGAFVQANAVEAAVISTSRGTPYA